MLRLRAWLVVALVLAAVGCSTTSGGEAQLAPSAATSHELSQAQSAAPTPSAAKASSRVELSPVGQDPVSVRVEVVSRDEDRQRGLMYRKQLDPDAGMLFIFERTQELTFWMRNTYLPLDMIFIAPDMSVLGVVENATPLTDDPRRVPGVSRYVLEVNAGYCRSHGIAAGTRVRFVDLPPEISR